MFFYMSIRAFSNFWTKLDEASILFRKFHQSRFIFKASLGALLFLVLIWLVFWALTEDEDLPQTRAFSDHQTVKLSALTEKQSNLLSQYISKNITLDSPTKTITTLYEVKGGQTLMAILISEGVKRINAYQSIKALRKNFDPRDLRKGTNVHLYFKELESDKKIFDGFELKFSTSQSILVRPDANQTFLSQRVNRSLLDTNLRINGKIRSSLYVDATKSGLAPEVIVEAIRLFSWDVDFQRDIHPGDSYDILVSRRYLPDGTFVEWGDIKFAGLTLKGVTKSIYRFKNDKGEIEYFDKTGVSTQKTLMKTPIDGARLSSRYGRRKHPILRYTKIHRGIDFAAPIGTPIYAAGNGKVVFVGRKGAYGKYIRIRHNSRYSTAYAHLSRYRKGIRRGKRVTQGQIIGYVGSTGRSTGPHLHYEVLVMGKQINPLKMKLPPGRKLKGNELVSFKRTRDEIDLLIKQLPSLQ
jgi:murein DD-endopeptidase MepM/ murein hydrolase activator NlpD